MPGLRGVLRPHARSVLRNRDEPWWGHVVFQPALVSVYTKQKFRQRVRFIFDTGLLAGAFHGVVPLARFLACLRSSLSDAEFRGASGQYGVG